MASTVSGKGIDHYKWHRPLKLASLVYERETGSDDGHIGSLGHLWRNTTFRAEFRHNAVVFYRAAITKTRVVIYK